MPTKDRHNEKLPDSLIEVWRSRVERLFEKHLTGYHVGPHYRIEGAYATEAGDWIKEPNFLIRGSGRADAIRALVGELKAGLLEEMGQALNQESIAVESSVFGLELLFLDEGENGDKNVEGRSKTERP